MLENYFKKESLNKNSNFCNIIGFRNALVHCNCSINLEEISSIIEHLCEKNEDGLINY